MAQLKANSSGPYSMVPDTVNSTHSMLNTVVADLCSDVVDVLEKSGTTTNVIDEVKISLSKNKKR